MMMMRISGKHQLVLLRVVNILNEMNLNVRNISAFKPFFRLMKLITKANNFLKKPLQKINNQKSRRNSKITSRDTDGGISWKFLRKIGNEARTNDIWKGFWMFFIRVFVECLVEMRNVLNKILNVIDRKRRNSKTLEGEGRFCFFFTDWRWRVDEINFIATTTTGNI